MQKGIAGNIASGFLNSKLSILLMAAILLIGVYSSSLIPREEDPQIDVPMVDVMVGYPGASPTEVESRVLIPLEKILSNIDGVEHLHSTAMNGGAMIIVQYHVGEDIERSYVKLYDELLRSMDQLPEGAMQPMIKSRSIDDVPILGLTLWSEEYSDFQIRQVAEELASELKKVQHIATVSELGGRQRQLRVLLDRAKLAQSNLDALGVMQMIQASNAAMQSGSYVEADKEILVTTGDFLRTKDDMERLIVGVHQQAPVYLGQVATIEDGPESPKSHVSFGYGRYQEEHADHPSEYPAVTLSVAKIQGADAMHLAKKVLTRLEQLEKDLVPAGINVTVTRNYGVTASEKVNELLWHLLIAIVAVTILVTLAMGWRGGLVVFLSVPLTFALTLFSYYILGYTLNRITLFALVFVVGIVVDDSIIIAENMHRHFKSRRLPFRDAAIYAINEVGNPTILATFTVIAAILPMAFVSGMMGPYMSPMPIGASIAMLLSLVVALTITPYLGYHLLRNDEEREGEEGSSGPAWISKFYHRFGSPLLNSPRKRIMLLAGTTMLLLASTALFLTKTVAVKMLPFDNKNEFQVVIDMPEGTTLERTAAVTREFAQHISTVPEVVNYQAYVGASSPITFNGLVRHYDLRSGSNMADIQVNLLGKGDRKEQSHAIAKRVRNELQELAHRTGANVKVVEVPPGPPVLSTIVAEIYGPDHAQQIKVAEQVKGILQRTEGVVDIDWSVEAPQSEMQLIVDKEKAMLNGIVPQQVVGKLTHLLREVPVSTLHDEHASKPVPVVLGLQDRDKASLNDLLALQVKGQHGNMVAVGDIVEIKESTLQPSISRKDQQRVVYVLADMAGELESPVYAILGMEDRLKAEVDLPAGYTIGDLYMGQPENDTNFTVKWDGEWQITLEVFRDLGIAFLVVMVIIYMLIVGWFQDFKTPIIMMIAIPLSLIGIVLGHWVLGAYFTATSFIGMIALAGIMVRNSVLLIDFIEIRLRDGAPIKEAIIDAGIVRTTPILLTTGAVIIGAAVILFDPIFQGLAISLVGGAIVSTMLTLLVVPVIYYVAERKKWAELGNED